jgi:hypothetical protein
VLLIPGTLLTFVLVLGLGAYVRGTRAEVPRDPAAGEGPVAQVVATAGGGREVRCALRLPFALEEVWDAVTDYDHFGDVCSCLQATRIAHEPDGGCRLEGRARSALAGFIPFEARLRHERRLEEYVTEWDEAGDRVRVNRGRWVLRSTGPRETLASLSLEVEVVGVPTFVLRNLSLGRLRDVLLGLERRLVNGPSGKPWTVNP